MILLLSPVNILQGYAVIESLNIFPNIAVFAILFYCWIALFLLLIFQKIDHNEE
jgi:hypothetical protein